MRHSPARSLFNVALGLTDGLLTALVLTAGTLVRGTARVDIGQALRVSTAAALSGLFTVLVSDYVRLRVELSHAAQELNLTSVRPLLASKLGSEIRRQALTAALITTACSFGGAMIPLTSAVLFRVGWAGPAAAAISLAAIGLALGRLFTGNSLLWAVLLLSGGATIALAGVLLHIVP
jgi:VIT1/CCC1 family predicted Fe2+/Mn2+ transporter